jgi:hypothetical protein
VAGSAHPPLPLLLEHSLGIGLHTEFAMGSEEEKAVNEQQCSSVPSGQPYVFEGLDHGIGHFRLVAVD